MSKYLVRAAMAASLVAVTLAFAVPTRAEEKPEKPKQRRYTGTIESMDAQARTVTLKNRQGDTKTFTCDPACKMSTADKKEATLDDFKDGDKITCWYTEDGGKLVCHKMGQPKSRKRVKEEKSK
jgi:Cu/Ag efflux protein CusF